jgi:nucleotide-binding universal stress UspA family protein
MFSRILLCSDGSESAQSATTVAADIALRFCSDVTLLSVFNSVDVLAAFALAPEAAPPLDVVTAIGDAAHDAVHRLSGGLLDSAHVPYSFRRELGHPVEAIVDTAESTATDLIVLGSRGLGTWNALLLGSVSEGVFHHARCPVLIVRGQQAPFAKILLASDGSAGAFLATQAAGALARKSAAELTVLNVVDPPGALSLALRPDHAAADARAREIVASRVRAMAGEADCGFTFRQESGHPAQEIVRFADENGFPLIVIGSRGMGALKSIAVGSVSNRVAHHAHCSVLVVR